MESSDDNSDEIELSPPDASRVARRAIALSALVYRGFLDQQSLESFSDTDARERLIAWIEHLGIRSEFDDHEWNCINAKVGVLDEQTMYSLTWLSEGLVVLAWALERGDLPGPDQQADPAEVSNRLGFMCQLKDTVLTRPSLRPREEIERYASMAFAVHWRLRDFTLRPVAINFPQVAANSWFGLDVTGIQMLDGDLSICGTAIAKSGEAARRGAMSIAQERHRAANWLLGYDSVYSEVETST